MGDIEKLKLVILPPIIVALALTAPNIAWAHTAAYEAGYNQGKLDLQHGTSEPASDVCDSMDFQGIDHDHCVVGYEDGVSGR